MGTGGCRQNYMMKEAIGGAGSWGIEEIGTVPPLRSNY